MGLGEDGSGKPAAGGPRLQPDENASRRIETERWIAEALPVLRLIEAHFATMAWNEAGPLPDGDLFEAKLKSLMAELPPVPWLADDEAIRAVCEPRIAKTIYHGLPIPDDYRYSVLFPEPITVGVGEAARTPKSFRLGLSVTEHIREGYGLLTSGTLVRSETIFE